MNLTNTFFFLFLLLLVACTPSYWDTIPLVPDYENPLITPSFCTVDNDCICGGIDLKTGDCFVGNTDYYAQNVNKSQQCPDFCGGIAGNLETKCVNTVCKNVVKPREQI